MTPCKKLENMDRTQVNDLLFKIHEQDCVVQDQHCMDVLDLNMALDMAAEALRDVIS